MIGANPQPFGDRLATLVEERESQLVLGLDPDPAKLWPQAVEAVEGGGESATTTVSVLSAARSAGVVSTSGSADTQSAPEPAAIAAVAVASHCRHVIAAVGDECVGVKLQLACFERLGAPGWWALEQTVTAAHEYGLIVIADGKRGDVPVSAAVYGEALFNGHETPWGRTPGLGTDAATINPLIGGDSLEPVLDAAWSVGGGVFSLVRTSNPGAVDIEDLAVAGGGTVSDRLAAMTAEIGEHYVGESGLSSLGAVVGATAPEHIGRLREAMPRAVFLIPGVGAQGGRVEDLAAAFGAGRAAALITVSRALVNAGDAADGDQAVAARAAAAGLRQSIWSVSG